MIHEVLVIHSFVPFVVAALHVGGLWAPPAVAEPVPCPVVGGQVRVLLLDMKATPRLQASAKGLGQIVAAEVARVPGFAIVSADDVRGALDQEANKALFGCDENSCLAELAQALDASLVVLGDLSETPDGAPLVSLTLLNTRAIVVVNRVSMAWPGAPGLLPEVVRAAARTLVLEGKQRPPGGLRLVGLPAEARVYLDGRQQDVAVHQGLATGPHEVKVLAPGKLPVLIYVVTAPGETADVALVFDDDPAVSPWVWAGAATAVLAGGAAALGLAYALGQSDVVVSAVVPSVSANDVETFGSKR